MKRPTEFIPIYDQTQKQAADMVEKLFVEIERLEGLASHTCAGCEEKDEIIRVRHGIIEELQGRGRAKDKRIKRDQESIEYYANREGNILKRLGDAREIVADECDCLTAHCTGNCIPGRIETTLNGGDGFLSGNPHHLGTDTALTPGTLIGGRKVVAVVDVKAHQLDANSQEVLKMTGIRTSNYPVTVIIVERGEG